MYINTHIESIIIYIYIHNYIYIYIHTYIHTYMYIYGDIEVFQNGGAPKSSIYMVYPL